jgi:hypothetical protein
MDERPLRERLAQDAGPVTRAALQAHADRGGLVLVAAGLDLLDVAEAVVRDQGDLVGAWVASGQLQRPSFEELDADHYQVVIAQPYVLAQRASGPSQGTQQPPSET